MSSGPGPVLVGLGIALVLVGLLVWSGALSWFGRLLGDVRIERESVHIYVPLVSMLIVSAALSLLLYLLRRLL
jgi:di/tricarboxylate transporter